MFFPFDHSSLKNNCDSTTFVIQGKSEKRIRAIQGIPILFTLNQKRMKNSCSFCCRESASVKCGGKCNQSYYCNQECANKDWTQHKEHCSLIGVNGNDDNDDWLSVKEQRRLELSDLRIRQLMELAEREGIEVRDRGRQVEWLKKLPRKEEIVNRILIALEERGQLDTAYVSPVKLITGPYRDIISNIVRNGEVATLLTLLTASSELKRIEDANPLLFWKEAFHLYFPEYAVTFVPEFVKALHQRGENTYRKLCLLLNWAHRRVLKRYEKISDHVRLIRSDNGFTTISHVQYLGKFMSTKHFAMLNGFPHGQLMYYYTKYYDMEPGLSFDEQLYRYVNYMKIEYWSKMIPPITRIRQQEEFFGKITNMHVVNFMDLAELCEKADLFKVPGTDISETISIWSQLPNEPLIETETGKMISIGEELVVQ